MRKRVLLPTKDNRIIVMNIDYDSDADLNDKLNQAKSYFSSHTYDEYVENHNHEGSNRDYDNIRFYVDIDNTNFLRTELQGYSYVRRRAEYQNLTHIGTYPSGLPDIWEDLDYSIPDDIVPEVVKSLGYTIRIKDDSCNIYYNAAENKYQTFDGKPAPLIGMDIDTNSRTIRVKRHHYNLPEADSNRLNELIAEYKRTHSGNMFAFANSLTDNKDRALFNLYSGVYNSLQKKTMLFYHEVKHLQNKVFYDSFYLNKGNIRLSVKDMYKLEVEDERTAYLSQVVNGVNAYLKKGDYADLSMFDGESSWLANKLQTMPITERKAYVADLSNIVNGSIKYFNSEHFNNYNDQFYNHTKQNVESAPMRSEEDKDHELYEKIRRQYYNFQIYNPNNGRLEYQNLSDYVKTENLVEEKEFPDLEARMTERLSEFEGKRHTLDLSLIDEARQVMLDNSRNPRFVQTDDCMNISSMESQPFRTDAPDDKAYWSDGLQEYWSKFDGYQKINKNNFEYSFKINDQYIRYNSTNSVDLSKNCRYDTYVKLLQEPSSAGKPIIFKDTLSKEQALYLYVACTLQNREMKGNLPKPAVLAEVDRLTDIPAADLDKFRQIISEHGAEESSHSTSGATRAGYASEPPSYSRIHNAQLQNPTPQPRRNTTTSPENNASQPQSATPQPRRNTATSQQRNATPQPRRNTTSSSQQSPVQNDKTTKEPPSNQANRQLNPLLMQKLRRGSR